MKYITNYKFMFKIESTLSDNENILIIKKYINQLTTLPKRKGKIKKIPELSYYSDFNIFVVYFTCNQRLLYSPYDINNIKIYRIDYSKFEYYINNELKIKKNLLEL